MKPFHRSLLGDLGDIMDAVAHTGHVTESAASEMRVLCSFASRTSVPDHHLVRLIEQVGDVAQRLEAIGGSTEANATIMDRALRALLGDLRARLEIAQIEENPTLPLQPGDKISVRPLETGVVVVSVKRHDKPVDLGEGRAEISYRTNEHAAVLTLWAQLQKLLGQPTEDVQWQIVLKQLGEFAVK